MQSLKHFFIALQFFTRIPITGRLAAWVGFSPAMLQASALYYPLVGTVVGLWAGAVLWLAGLALGHSGLAAVLAAIAGTAASVWLTGGFHEDGLADTADGLGGYVSAEKALDIMKDSRIGSYGSLTLLLVLLAKISSLALLAQHSLLGAAVLLLWAHTLSRALPLFVMWRLPHVGDLGRSKSKPLADAIDLPRLLLALIWPVALSAALFAALPSALWLAAPLLALLLTAHLGRWFRQRIGGFTGDTLGCVQQLSELALYLSGAAALHWGFV